MKSSMVLSLVKSSAGSMRPILLGAARPRVPTDRRGVLELSAAHAAALQQRQPELREAAIAAANERAAAKAHARAVADQVKRTAGQTDISKLTVYLIKEELRLRRARGEDIPRLPTSRGEALEMIANARRAVPNIPAPPVADPRSAPRSVRRGHRRGPTEGRSCTRRSARSVSGVGRGRWCAYQARHDCGAPAACDQIPIFGTPRGWNRIRVRTAGRQCTLVG
jgi:hypothetical protein